MRFFVDTADVDQIRKANDMGVICGVTTNPSLIAKSGRQFDDGCQIAKQGIFKHYAMNLLIFFNFINSTLFFYFFQDDFFNFFQL